MIKSQIKNFIFPRGKVHKNYKKYVGWSCFSNFIMSIEGVLSTHSMLSVIGHTNSELNFSLNYIGKDIIGQLGGLYYMNKMGQKADKDHIKFIKYSMIFQQTSIFMECGTPLLPVSFFIPVAGIANIGKNIAFTGIGAINAKIIGKLAKDNNIGEIYAKISVLNTLASTIGMGVGLIIAARVPDHYMRLSIMPFFACIKIYSYNKAIQNII